MAKLFNRAKVNTATAGTGTVTLGAAFSNAFCTFAEAGVANGNVVAYVIEDGTDFEIGIGTYTAAGTTLSRDTVRLSKIAGVAGTTKITLSGAAVVYLSPAREDLLSILETQTANQVYAGPTTGGAAAPTFRALVAADLPYFAAGTAILFQQTAAPIGWTKQTTHNDKALRVVSGTASSGGTSAFSTVFGKTATDATTLTITLIPAHNHGTNIYSQGPEGFSVAEAGGDGFGNTDNAGGGGSHIHGMDIRVQYVDVIIATKD